jgi:formylglycine-generating enzyme required for sulfatase activity
MNCVNWFEAYAFCIWDGGFLPSEAEYEFAAAGGNEQRKYPWGAQDAATNSKYAICNCNYPDASGSCTGLSNLAPVGTATLGAGRWGHLDLVGNVTEWNLDWFSPTFVNPCTDCANLSDGSGKVIRDGYFSSSDGTLQISYRNSLYPTNRFYSFGFRCARTP